MWPLDFGFRGNDERREVAAAYAIPSYGCAFSSCCRIASMTSGLTVS